MLRFFRVLLTTLSVWAEPSIRVALSLTGSGWGHGAGLCQWGSYEMGKRGLAAKQILAHYYPGCSLQALK